MHNKINCEKMEEELLMVLQDDKDWRNIVAAAAGNGYCLCSPLLQSLLMMVPGEADEDDVERCSSR